MVLAYTEMQSTLKVVNYGGVTLTAGPDEIGVLNLTASPYAHGIHSAMVYLSSMDLTGTATLTISGNTATDGSGTDTVLATKVATASDTDCVLEVAAELLSHFSDRAADGTQFKSLVIDVDGTNTDTIDACVVVHPMQRQTGLTPSDVAAVT